MAPAICAASERSEASAESTFACWPATRLQQVLRALERQLGIGVLRLQLRHIRLVSLDLRLKRRLLEAVEEIALLDLGALDEEPLFEKRADPGNERHPTHRLDAADELVGLGDLLALGAHHPDRRRPVARAAPGMTKERGRA